MITTIIILAVILIGIDSYFYNKHKSKEEVTQIKEVSSVNKSKKEILEYNILLRTSNIPQEEIKLTEELIDNLLLILDEVNKKENFSESTIIINRIVSKYLPEYFKSYSNSGYSSVEYKKGIEVLNDKVISISNQMLEGNLSEFNKQLTFLNNFLSEENK